MPSYIELNFFIEGFKLLLLYKQMNSVFSTSRNSKILKKKNHLLKPVCKRSWQKTREKERIFVSGYIRTKNNLTFTNFLTFFLFLTDWREAAKPNGRSCWATAGARGRAGHVNVRDNQASNKMSGISSLANKLTLTLVSHLKESSQWLYHAIATQKPHWLPSKINSNKPKKRHFQVTDSAIN